uniref:Uncharacterized protein n=1 Tax=Xiphophorus maculatus TaxID=8083 RepID=A0A3B5R715_XIPMA
VGEPAASLFSQSLPCFPVWPQSSRLSDDSRMSRSSRLDLKPVRGSVLVLVSSSLVWLFLPQGPRAASALTAATFASVGGTSSRRGSGETALTVDADGSIREIKEALAEVEEKYRKAMVSNAQLDNEKNNLMYQVDTLKDSLMELEELLSESRRQYDDKLKEFERQKHNHSVLQFQFDELKETLKQSEELLNVSDPPLPPAPLPQGSTRTGPLVKLHIEFKLKALNITKYLFKNHLSCDELAPEAQTCFPSEETHLHGQITADPIDRPDPKAKAVIVLSQDLQQIQTSGEMETSEVDSISHPGLTQTQSTGTEAAGGDLSGGQESKQEVVTTEPLGKQAVPVGLNSEPQQEPEEAENDEAEETASTSQAQVSTASGKKKKRKKKGKKKGGPQENKDQQKAGTEKQNEKTSKDSVVQNNGLTAEQDTSGSTAKPQDNQEPEKVEHLEPSENVCTKENLQEPNTDPGSEGHNQEKTTEGADGLGSTQEPRLGVEMVDDTQNQECEDPEKPNEGSAVESLKESEITGSDQEGNLVTCKSKDDPDLSEDIPARENASGLQQSTTDHVSGDEGKTGNTEMLEQSDTVGSSEISCHIRTRAELSEDEQNKETSPTAKETAEPPEGFLQDKPLEESDPESKMVEGDARETNLPSNKGIEGPNKHLPSCDDTGTTPAFQEPDNDHVSGNQEEETLTFKMLEEADAVESPETPDEELVQVLQNQEETSGPEKHESVLQTTETSQAETIKGPNESETAEDVKEMESETGSDREANLLTSGKSEDPVESFPPDSSSPEDQNVRTKSESVDGDEKMINNPESIVELAGEEHDGVPESRTGSEINEETSASSANNDARDPPETSSTSKSPKPSMTEPEEAAEPDDGEPSETSEEICRDDEELNGGRGEPEDPPLHMKDEVELADLTKAETGDTGSPPKEEQKEATAERPEPEDCPNTEEVKTSQGLLAEQVKESMEEPEGDDSPPYVQLDRDEDDGEEDEGQSFDFDDLDVEAAVESSLPNKLEQEDVEEGTEVNGKSPELCQSNAETKTEDGEEKVSEDDNSKIDQPSTQNDLPCGDNTPEKVENVPENIEQKTSSTVEDGLDATDVASDPQKTPEQTDGAKEAPQVGKDPKKKKGKGKSKEDCKMS